MPAFNEERGLEKILSKMPRGIQAIVVDDGSQDKTAEVALGYSPKGILFLKHERNEGKGIALRTGFDFALKTGYDLIITMDADGQHLISDLPLLLDKAKEGFDVVIGCRKYSEMPFTRRTANIASSLIYRLRTGNKIKDTQSGFRAFKPEVLENIEIVDKGYMAEFELLVRVAQSGYKTAEVDIKTIYSAEIKSKIKPLQQIYRFLKFNFIDFFNYDIKNLGKDKGYLKNLAKAKLKRSKI